MMRPPRVTLGGVTKLEFDAIVAAGRTLDGVTHDARPR